ncbi:MAG: hypothetical protein ACYDGN_16285 [Acidimicrobiales bacterium]
MTPSKPRSWDALAAGTKRRWISQAGGPRSQGHAARERRARAAYEAGAKLDIERTGHLPPPQITWSAALTTEGVRPLTTTSRVETSRQGTHSGDVRQVLDGELAPDDFTRRWSRRKRTIGGYELEPDGYRVLELKRQTGPVPEPFYVKQLIRRPRRSRAA